MAFTKEDLTSVERAIAKGERLVRYQDRTVEYRDVDELLRARDEISRQLATATVTRPRVTRLYSKGKGI